MWDKITVAEALGWLWPLLGTGGLTAILVAWFGYRPKLPRNDQVMQFGAILADRSAMERAAQSAERLSESIDRHGESLRDLTRAVEHIDFSRPTRQR